MFVSAWKSLRQRSWAVVEPLLQALFWYRLLLEHGALDERLPHVQVPCSVRRTCTQFFFFQIRNTAWHYILSSLSTIFVQSVPTLYSHAI